MANVGRYQLQETIGEGGMGVVYKAFDPLLERTVAIKLISTRLDEFPDLHQRFFSEAKAAGRLSHKNIVTIYDLGEENGQPYFAMELLEGRNLRVRMHSGVAMSLARKLDIVTQVCDGLSYAHAHGIVHRDVKPANLFITDSGQIKILDFGLARLPNSDFTRSRTLLGTFNYMSPEQINGEVVDHRADIFSTGVVLYELLTDRSPFKGDSVASVLHKILQEEPEPVDRVNPNLPRGLSAIVTRAIAKAREERYADLGEMLVDLAACRAELLTADKTPVPQLVVSVSTPHASGASTGSLSKLTRRFGWRVAAVGGVPVIAVAGWLFLRPGAQPLPHQPHQAPARTATTLPLEADRPMRSPSAPPAPAPSPPASPQDTGSLAIGTVGRSVVPPRATAPSTRAADEADRKTAERDRERAEMARRASESVRAADLSGGTYAAARDAEVDGTRLFGLRQFSAAGGRFREAAARFSDAEGEARAAIGHMEAQERQRELERGRATAARSAYSSARARAAEAAVERSALSGLSRADARAAEAQGSFERGEWPDATRGFEAANSLLEDVLRLAREARTAAAAVSSGPPPPPAAAAPDATVAAEHGIEEALGRYVAAFESRSVPALKRVWPSLDGGQERAIRDEFEHAAAISVSLENPNIQVSGASTATVTCQRHYRLHTDDGRRLQSDTLTRMTFKRSGSSWIIDSVRYDIPR